MEKESKKANEKAVFEYVEKYILENKTSPTVREICVNIGIKSTSTVHRYLHRLEEKGEIIMPKGKNRSIKIPSLQGVQIPVLKEFRPNLLVQSNIEKYIEIPFFNDYSKKIFAVKITSADVSIGVQNGDIAVVSHCDFQYPVKLKVTNNNQFRLAKTDKIEDSFIGSVILLMRNYTKNEL